MAPGRVWEGKNCLSKRGKVRPCAGSAQVLLSSIQSKAETLNPRTSKKSFRKSFHHVSTNKGSVVKQSGTEVEDFQFFL